MVKAKILKLSLDGYGCYLGRGEGCFEVRDKNKKVTRYPHFEKEIGEAVLKSGSYVSACMLLAKFLRGEKKFWIPRLEMWNA